MKNDPHILPKVMLLTKQLDPDPRGGREMLCKLNYDALSSLFGDRLVVVQLPFARPSNPREILNTFRGYIDGLSDQIINDTIKRIQCSPPCFRRWLESWWFVATKQQLNTEVTSFFHNVEARFFWVLRYGQNTSCPGRFNC